ncbi:collagen alpha-4(VI) chain-like [Mercenaria mercenaria]|uniref:collagen alpha-4(VI) chain-like n=1 Tax=Mercenaria mercenaria TaxID=6596 RepID=UPI00234F451D|nr:collagen alpha-4(VI) chain-like [Mercenaria mercenaria]
MNRDLLMSRYVLPMMLTFAVAEGYVEPPNCYQQTAYPFITEKQSRMFIKVHRGRRAVDCTNKVWPIDCISDEVGCECNMQACSKESDREHYCHAQGTHCGPGMICYLSVPCPVHWTTTCTDDACLSYPCKYGTCTDGIGTYTCTCQAGYEGINCETETNECDSNPCQNGGTCHDHLNSYTCTCTEDYTGINCEIDMCKPQFPTGADVVFLLDTSKSQDGVDFENQKQYVKDFISDFPIGPNDFQIALVTASLNAKVYFYLDSYSDDTKMMSAIDSIVFDNGPSFTGKGLLAIREQVFTAAKGARNGVYKYVLVLSDGLSSDPVDTILQADLLKKTGVDVISVAIGNQINHKELADIASLWRRVFPASSKDAVNAILKAHVMDECPDCYHSTSDVAIIVDSSGNISPVNYHEQISALGVLLNAIPIGADSIHVSLSHFSHKVEDVFPFNLYFSAPDMIIKLNGMRQSSASGNVTNALKHLRQFGFRSSNGARTETRKLALLVTSGNLENENQHEVLTEAKSLKDTGVILATISIDANINMTSLLLEMASDPMYMYAIGNDLDIGSEVLYTLIGSLDFDVCEMD